MKQLIENLKNGTLSVVNVPVPHCGANDILVRNIFSLVSPGTEKSMIELGKKNLVSKAAARPDLAKQAYQKAKREGFISVFKEALARLDQPLPLGYSSSGVVIKTGKNIKDISAGDYVACAGSNYASHAEVISVPRDLVVKLPGSITSENDNRLEDASFVMLGGIAMQGFRSAQMTFGENVVVVGLGLIGLLTAQIAKAYGCNVIGIDVDQKKTALAKTMGCDHVFTIGKSDVELAVANVTNGYGADAVLLCAATNDNKPILLAEAVTRKKGRIVLVGVSDITLTRKAFWDKELSFTVSKASGPWVEGSHLRDLPLEHVRWTERRNHEEFIRLLSNGSVRVQELITHRFSIDSATEAYGMILRGKERYIGVLINYPASAHLAEHDARTIQVVSSVSGARPVSELRTNVGFIGAGAFTKNILLPQVAKIDRLAFKGVSAKTGLSADHLAKKYGFTYTTTDYKSLLSDSGIGSVFITTRHDMHAAMIEDALESGKNVYVEKPLCITRTELDRLTALFSRTPAQQLFYIGFNRRYSPLATMLKGSMAGRKSPLQMLYRVNAGFIPYDHWTHDPAIGGGRIIGEVCHFVDLMQYLSDAVPVEVSARSIGESNSRYQSSDSVELTIGFSDGSLGTIIYSALGTKSVSRERIEVFFDETVGILDDFRQLEVSHGSQQVKKKLWSQDMGYTNALNAFFTLTPEEGLSIRDSAIITTKTTFSAMDALRSKRTEII